MFNYYPENINASGWGWHSTTSAETALSAEEHENVVVEEVIPEACACADNVNAAAVFLQLDETHPSSLGPVTYQNFEEIRSRIFAKRKLFKDPQFPAIYRSLYVTEKLGKPIIWLRPMQICKNPQFFVGGYSRFDVRQGKLGNCWLLAAIANLTLNRKLFFQVVPDGQSFDEDYAGVFHFRFWQFGSWVDVVIDDLLPTFRKKLLFLHSTEKNEFWGALLEKAYAKLHGSYESLRGGSASDAMTDVTGGVTETYDIAELPPTNFFTILLKAYERNSLSSCSIKKDPNVKEAKTPAGLIRGHAYSVTKVKYVDVASPGRAESSPESVPLIRLRNPWGSIEWNGPWSDKCPWLSNNSRTGRLIRLSYTCRGWSVDGSPEWQFISESEKEKIGLTFDHDGEFWMSFKDFVNHFSIVEICNLNPDSLDPEECPEGCTKKWEMSVFRGEWVRDVTAGGRSSFKETFWMNPRYTVTLEDVDEGDNENKCTMIVALMQKSRRSQKPKGLKNLRIGFDIYRLKPHIKYVPKRKLTINFFKHYDLVGRSRMYFESREVTARFKLDPGSYVIVPSTFDPNEEGEFLLRVFSEKCNNMTENDEGEEEGESEGEDEDEGEREGEN